jgi:hypothetical protein
METTNSLGSSVTYYQLTMCPELCQEYICSNCLSRKTSGSLIGPNSVLQNTSVSDRMTLCYRLPSLAFARLRLYIIPFPHYPPSHLIFSYYFRFRRYFLKGKDYPIKCPSQRWRFVGQISNASIGINVIYC